MVLLLMLPSLHICSMLQEPPVVGVHFDVPNRNGGINAQVFEKSALYRWIVTAGDEPRSHQISAILSTNSLFFAHQRGTWYVQLPSIYRTPPSRKNCVESCHGVWKSTNGRRQSSIRRDNEDFKWSVSTFHWFDLYYCPGTPSYN